MKKYQNLIQGFTFIDIQQYGTGGKNLLRSFLSGKWEIIWLWHQSNDSIFSWRNYFISFSYAVGKFAIRTFCVFYQHSWVLRICSTLNPSSLLQLYFQYLHEQYLLKFRLSRFFVDSRVIPKFWLYSWECTFLSWKFFNFKMCLSNKKNTQTFTMNFFKDCAKCVLKCFQMFS